MEAYGVASWGKWVKIGILLASMLYLIQPMIGTTSSQYSQFEKMIFLETFCDKVDGSWIISLVVANDGSCDMTGWINKILVGDVSVEDQAFDLIFIDHEDNLLHADDLSTRIEFIIPDGKCEFIQFNVPEEAITEDCIQLKIHSAGGMDYYKKIDLYKSKLLHSSTFDLGVIRKKFA